METNKRWTTDELEALESWSNFMKKTADRAELDFCYWLLERETKPEIAERLKNRIDELELELV